MSADRSEPAIAPVKAASGISWPVVVLAGILVTAGVVLAIVFLRPPGQQNNNNAGSVTVINTGGNTDEDTGVAAPIARRDAGAVPEARDAGATNTMIEPPLDASVQSDAGSATTQGPNVHDDGHPVQHPTAITDPRVLLTRTFMRQRSKVARCVESNAGDISGVSSIEIRFEIDKAGKVMSASITTPAAQNNPGFGRCVLSFARAISFGPQPDPIAFRIPVGLRQVNAPR
jgi:hypothetical protein